MADNNRPAGGQIVNVGEELVRMKKDLSSLTVLLAALIKKNLTPEQILEAGSVAAEMLVHFGRGQKAAENGTNHTEFDLALVRDGTEIFERGTDPEIVERMFRVFAESVADSNRKTTFNINSAVRKRVCGYSFLLGNLAWQSRDANNKIQLDKLRAEFDKIKAQCPDLSSQGGGEFCHMGPF